MPPKKNVNGKAAKKKVATKGYKLPDPIEPGQIVTDICKKQWRIGKSIGQGGFGEIYLASENINKPVEDTANYVLKIEPHSNGPLFTEVHCYMRVAKPQHIESWKKEHKLKSFGMPKFIGSGSMDYKGQKYRFMVMERFGSDLQKIIEKHKKQFSFKTVSIVAMQILDVLEYMHHSQYIHADIKASNLLVGHKPGTENQVFLVDFGLACKYTSNGIHKEYKYDQRKAHDGTIEFTSRDAHIGAHSRRGDLEILGYNMVQWLCGKLPWEDKLEDCNYVANQKRAHMEDIPKFMLQCFPEGIPPGIQEYMEYVSKLTFDEKPLYDKCKSIMREALKARGHKDDGKLVFMSATPKPAAKVPRSVLGARKRGLKRKSEEQENLGLTPQKTLVDENRLPCMPTNLNSNRKTTRTHSLKSPKFVSLSKTNHVVEHNVDPEDLIIENENKKMAEKNKKLRPRRLVAKKDNSLVNPTPQMLEIMARIKEKSISPPSCHKRHRHHSHCYLTPFTEEQPTYLTPAMEEVIRKNGRSPSEYSQNASGSTSPQLFESDEESACVDDVTVYYSPCDGGDNCTKQKHALSPHNTRRRKDATKILKRDEVKKPIPTRRITRSQSSKSPEIP